MKAATRLIGRFGVDLANDNFLGATRVRLLEAIERCGSISQAAKAVPLSYKAAWDAVDAMNNLAESPLVERVVGGRNGGGTRLTDYGRRVVAAFRAMESEYQQALDRISATLSDPEAGETLGLHRLMRGMAVTSSARNQFMGPVMSLRAGEVSYEVGIRIDPSTEIVAQISRESAEQLRIGIGRELHAWINSSAVILLVDETLKISARNQLWGKVLRIHEGPVAAEVVLALPGERTVSSIVTREAIAELDLKEGDAACAAFKASSVTLCAFD